MAWRRDMIFLCGWGTCSLSRWMLSRLAVKNAIGGWRPSLLLGCFLVSYTISSIYTSVIISSSRVVGLSAHSLGHTCISWRWGYHASVHGEVQDPPKWLAYFQFQPWSAKTLLAPGLTTRSKDATRGKEATRGSWLTSFASTAQRLNRLSPGRNCHMLRLWLSYREREALSWQSNVYPNSVPVCHIERCTQRWLAMPHQPRRRLQVCRQLAGHWNRCSVSMSGPGIVLWQQMMLKSCQTLHARCQTSMVKMAYENLPERWRAQKLHQKQERQSPKPAMSIPLSWIQRAHVHLRSTVLMQVAFLPICLDGYWTWCISTSKARVTCLEFASTPNESWCLTANASPLAYRY